MWTVEEGKPVYGFTCGLRLAEGTGLTTPRRRFGGSQLSADTSTLSGQLQDSLCLLFNADASKRHFCMK